MKSENTMSIRVKPYTERSESTLNGEIFYVLSFKNGCHLKLTARAFHIIKCLNGTMDMDDIIHALNKEGYIVSELDLNKFVTDFLIPRKLLEGQDDGIVIHKNHDRLWIRRPLVESGRFIWFYRIVQPLFAKPVVLALVLASAFSLMQCLLMLSNGQFNFINQLNSVQIILISIFAMFIHELGHAAAAYRYNVTTGKIGVGLYLITLVFYIDLTNTWSLDKKQRAICDLSGMYFQSMVALIVLAAYLFTGATSLIVTALIIYIGTLSNLFPFLRLDGYWLLSDCVGIQNLNLKLVPSIMNGGHEILRYIAVRKSSREYTLNRERLFCGIYGIVYLTAIVFMFAMGILSFWRIIIDFPFLLSKFQMLAVSFTGGDVANTISILNALFVLPFIFVIIYLMQSVLAHHRTERNGKCYFNALT